MLELDARPLLAVGDEAHLDFRLEIRVVLPIRADVPRQHEARRRLPGQYASPVARAAVVAPLVPAAADARLDHRVHGVGLDDFVGRERQPGGELLRENPQATTGEASASTT